MFRIGQKVVCVDAKARHPRVWCGDVPVEGRIYTIAATNCDVSLLTLAEIRNVSRLGNVYLASRFRPVVERKTDISIFTDMLTPSPITVDAFNLADHAREIVG